MSREIDHDSPVSAAAPEPTVGEPSNTSSGSMSEENDHDSPVSAAAPEPTVGEPSNISSGSVSEKNDHDSTVSAAAPEPTVGEPSNISSGSVSEENDRDSPASIAASEPTVGEPSNVSSGSVSKENDHDSPASIAAPEPIVSEPSDISRAPASKQAGRDSPASIASGVYSGEKNMEHQRLASDAAPKSQPASISQDALLIMQSQITAEVNRQLETMKAHFAKEQAEALQKVEELQQRSIELETEVELRWVESAAKPQREESISVPEPASCVSAAQSTESISMPESAPRVSAAQNKESISMPEPASRVSAGHSKESISMPEPASCMSAVPERVKPENTVPTVGGSNTATAARRFSLGGVIPPERPRRLSSAEQIDSDLQIQRHWMMEQREILLDDLFPEGDPFRRKPRRSLINSRKSM